MISKEEAPAASARKANRRARDRVFQVALGLNPSTSYSRQKLQGVLAWMRKHSRWRVTMHEAQPYLPLKQLLKWQ